MFITEKKFRELEHRVRMLEQGFNITVPLEGAKDVKYCGYSPTYGYAEYFSIPVFLQHLVSLFNIKYVRGESGKLIINKEKEKK